MIREKENICARKKAEENTCKSVHCHEPWAIFVIFECGFRSVRIVFFLFTFHKNFKEKKIIIIFGWFGAYVMVSPYHRSIVCQIPNIQQKISTKIRASLYNNQNDMQIIREKRLANSTLLFNYIMIFVFLHRVWHFGPFVNTQIKNTTNSHITFFSCLSLIQFTSKTT